MTPDSEIGHKLDLTDLYLNRIVVIKIPGQQNLYITARVAQHSPVTVGFIAVMNVENAMFALVVNFIQGEKIVDDRGREVEVFEYLGKE